MKFSDYNQMLSLSNTVIEAVAYMMDNNSIELINDCVNATIEIETHLKLNTNSLKSTELLDDISDIKSKLENIQSSDDLADIFNQYIDFNQKCPNLIKRTYKLLFAAELAGKWDSMSSVYEAAKNRDDCVVDVVIQPIFRSVNLPNGQNRTEVIYDDYLTPLGIKHTLYKNYSFEKEQPDITFISQPYESCTIDMFWPQNIANYSKVVYLPYYTALLLSKGGTIHSFFNSNTVKLAWKLACQSEKMAKFYNGITENRGKNVVVSGLPKWDPIINAYNQPILYPDSWNHKLEGKTVFLWNTHFSTDVSPSNLLKKGFEFIKIFKERKDIALIWRPHPMTETVIKTYVPERHKDFVRLKNTIERSENMVADFSTSILPAYHWANALISDYSSIIPQFLLFDNRPILMLVNNSIEEGLAEYNGLEELFDFNKIELASTISEQKTFIDNIVNGIDVKKDARKELINDYYYLADGKCGERFLNTILDDYIKEFDAPAEEIYFDESKTVIIGDVNESLACVKQLQKNNSEIYFLKEFLNSNDICDYNVISLKDLNKFSDNLFIITKKDSAINTRNFLINNYNIKRERILSFWDLYKASMPTMVCDKILQNPNNNNFEGVILGTSHAEIGIVKEYLDAEFCNLSVSSQDLYFQYKTLEYSLTQYAEKFKNLKYAIIDLYDYSYFNYDTSLSASSVKYLTFGGFNLDKHHFDENKSHNATFEETLNFLEQSKYKNIIDTDLLIWEQLFADVYELANYELFNSNFEPLRTRLSIVSDNAINNYQYNRSAVTKLFPETIKENAENLEKIFCLLQKANPDIKIFTVLLPKYVETEAFDAKEITKHIPTFHKIIDDLQQKYNFTHLDFKKISELSYDKSLFNDANHFNYFGALKFTSELNKHIFGD